MEVITRSMAEFFHSFLNYDPETGELTWRETFHSRMKKGNKAGCVHRKNRKSIAYREVRIRNKVYLAHRIIMTMVNGACPDGQVDHIDGNGLNNRLSNLRVVTNKENGRNQSRHVTNTSGHTGVTWHKQKQKWHAQIVANGKRYHLGYFQNITEAVLARRSAESVHGFHLNHGRDRHQIKNSEIY